VLGGISHARRQEGRRIPFRKGRDHLITIVIAHSRHTFPERLRPFQHRFYSILFWTPQSRPNRISQCCIGSLGDIGKITLCIQNPWHSRPNTFLLFFCTPICIGRSDYAIKEALEEDMPLMEAGLDSLAAVAWADDQHCK